MPLFKHFSLQCLQLVSSVSSKNIESGVSIVSNILSVNSLCDGAASIFDSSFFSFSFMNVPICRRSSLTPGVHYLRSSCFPSEEEQSGLMNAPQEVESWGYFNTSASFTIAPYGQLRKYPYWTKQSSCNSVFGDCCALRSIGCVTPHMMFWWAITGAGRPNSSLMEK